MRPISIEVEGLRSFREPQLIDLTGRDHIAIIGDTGAGKSSLLEAITWALFGRTTFTGQPNQELMNDTYTTTRVTMRFVVAGQSWEVTRLLRRAGDGTVGGARASLSRLDDEGEPLVTVEQVRAVNEKVEEVLGLDFDAFVRTVLLPQGQFAQLLVADGPTERAAILRQVWRTDELEAVGAAAKEVLLQLQPLSAQANERLAGQPEDPHAHLAELGAAAERRTTAAHELADSATEVAAAAATITSTGRAADAAAAAADLADVDLTDQTAAAQRIAIRAAELDEALTEVADRDTQLRADLDDVPADDEDGPDRVAVADARVRLAALPDLAQAAVAAATQATTAAQEVDAARTGLTELAEEAATAARATTDDATTTEQLTEHRDQARQQLRDATGLLDLVRGRHETRATLQAEFGQARTDAEQAAAAADTATAAAERAEKDLNAARDVLTALLREEAVAAAAQHVHPGDDCPLCTQTIPDDWTRPTVGDLDVAEQAVATAAHQLDTARAKADDAAAAARDAATAVTTLSDRIAQHDIGTSDLARQLGELTGADIDADAEVDDTVLNGLAAAADDARTALEEHTEAARRRQTAAAQAAAAVEQQEKDLRRAEEAAQTAAEQTAAARRTLAERIADLHDLLDLNPDLADTATDELQDRLADVTTAAAATLDARDETLSARAARRTELDEALETTRSEHRRLTELRRTEVISPATKLLDNLAGIRDRLRTVLDRLNEHVDEIPAAPTLPPADEPARLPDIVNALRDALEAAVRTGQQLATDTVAARDAATDTVHTAATTHDLGADAPARVVDAVQQLAADARAEARRAVAARDRFAERVNPLVALQEATAELDARVAVVADVAAALNPGSFPKWLTIRRSHALLVHASRLLGEMTGGRYAFADVTDDADTWQVVDNDSGLPRSPASLSGGEKFMASLALALGMVEMMARAGGRLESLWLDEGFGALDRSSLDAAVEALAGAATGGRLVAVISHVAAVAEQIDHVLAVTRSSTGSKVRWLDPAEQAGLATSDLDVDVADALSGLLD